jgi:hypothetical protein
MEEETMRRAFLSAILAVVLSTTASGQNLLEKLEKSISGVGTPAGAVAATPGYLGMAPDE